MRDRGCPKENKKETGVEAHLVKSFCMCSYASVWAELSFGNFGGGSFTHNFPTADIGEVYIQRHPLFQFSKSLIFLHVANEDMHTANFR